MSILWVNVSDDVIYKTRLPESCYSQISTQKTQDLEMAIIPRVFIRLTTNNFSFC